MREASKPCPLGSNVNLKTTDTYQLRAMDQILDECDYYCIIHM